MLTAKVLPQYSSNYLTVSLHELSEFILKKLKSLARSGSTPFNASTWEPEAEGNL